MNGMSTQIDTELSVARSTVAAICRANIHYEKLIAPEATRFDENCHKLSWRQMVWDTHVDWGGGCRLCAAPISSSFLCLTVHVAFCSHSYCTWLEWPKHTKTTQAPNCPRQKRVTALFEQGLLCMPICTANSVLANSVFSEYICSIQN